MAGNEIADLYARQATEESRASRTDGKGIVSMALLKRRRPEGAIGQWREEMTRRGSNSMASWDHRRGGRTDTMDKGNLRSERNYGAHRKQSRPASIRY